MKKIICKKQNKVFIAFLISIVFLTLICIGGCNSAPVPMQETTVDKTAGYVIGVSLPTTKLVYRKAMMEFVKAAYPDTQETSATKVLVYDADGSQKKQNQDLLEMTDMGVDGIVLVPNTMEGCLSAVEYANAKNIPIITVDNRISSSSSAQVLSFVGADHFSMGKDAATLFLQLLSEKYPEQETWNVIQLTGIPDSSGAIDRGQAITDALSSNERIHLLGSYDGEFTVSHAKSVIEDCLKIYDQIDGVICQNDNMAEGCYLALKEAKRDGTVIVVGIDGQKSTLEIMEAGGIHGTVLQHPTMILDGIKYLCSYLDGVPLDNLYIKQTDLIDKNNVSYYLEYDLSW